MECLIRSKSGSESPPTDGARPDGRARHSTVFPFPLRQLILTLWFTERLCFAMNITRSLSLCLLIRSACFAASQAPAPGRPPNLVFILTDNEGAWMLGCYGNPDIRTPAIDRLAAEGIRFTRALSSNPVCSPTRATFLTGLIPSQHGVHRYLGGEKPNAQMGPAAYDVIREFPSLPKILRDAGYACGLVGKWHLGANLTPQEGFSYWITMPTGHTTEFYDVPVIENGQVRREPKYLTDLWTEHGVRFIEQNKDRPFFLYLAYNGPYGLGGLLRNPARNRHAAYYADKLLLSFPRDTMHPWLVNNKEFLNNPTAIRRVAAETSGVDDGVGEIMATLKRLGLDENTLVVYAADQGWMGGHNGIWGMGDHTRPIGAFEQMMHIPLIFRQPGRIPAGKTSDILVCNYDFLPSVLAYLGLTDKTPTNSPGRDFSPVLTGRSIPWENVTLYEMENTRAIRAERWKYVARHPDGPFELYDMATDPGERVNLYGQPRQATVQRQMAARLDAFFAKYADPQYDLWHGGRSKAGTPASPVGRASPTAQLEGRASRPPS
jgi:arylsulfatase A-like enzyme